MSDLRISVLGTGYLGATHAACMAELGFEVLGLDVDKSKVDLLASGTIPFYEPGLDELLAKHVATGRLRFTTSYEEAGAFGDVHFICVGTPQKKGEFAADMKYVDAATQSLLPHLKPGALVVGKSTVPAGTARRLEALILESAPSGVEVAWNPEFLREGWAVQDTLAPDRLVIGVNPGGRAESILRRVYAGLLERETPLVVVDFATAELVKVAANAFLATKISFINAMAEVCEATGADVKLLSQALSYDTRIGGRFLHAGLGFGGGCLPKDIRAFMARAGELGVDQALSFLREVDAINMRRRTRMVDLARELTGGSFSGGVKVGVLGAAFKPNSDDVRDSPALDVSKAIHLQGAEVRVYDPQANETAARIHPELTYCDSAIEAVSGAHIVLHLTEWREFRDMDPSVLSEVVALKRIVDGRNALDADAWRAAGWVYRALGRPLA
jgi:UDPglucose 6-dehydrogenase